ETNPITGLDASHPSGLASHRRLQASAPALKRGTAPAPDGPPFYPSFSASQTGYGRDASFTTPAGSRFVFAPHFLPGAHSARSGESERPCRGTRPRTANARRRSRTQSPNSNASTTAAVPKASAPLSATTTSSASSKTALCPSNERCSTPAKPTPSATHGSPSNAPWKPASSTPSRSSPDARFAPSSRKSASTPTSPSKSSSSNAPKVKPPKASP